MGVIPDNSSKIRRTCKQRCVFWVIVTLQLFWISLFFGVPAYGESTAPGGKAPFKMEFPFTNPDDGREYTLTINDIYYNNNIILYFLEHVFDYQNYRHSMELLAKSDADEHTIFRSTDLGRSWEYAARINSMPSLMFTTAAGSRLVWDKGTNKLVRITTEWQESAVINSPAYSWHGSQGIGQHGATIMLAEYWVDAARTEGHVYRSRDDGRSWEIVFTMPSLGSSAPSQDIIRHFHVLQPDFYCPGHWYLSSGDGQQQCRVWHSQDDGNTWLDVTDHTPEGTSLQAIHRFTSIHFGPEEIVWGTDDMMNGTGAKLVKAYRGHPLDIRAAANLTINHIRNIISTEIGFIGVTENSYNNIIPGFNEPGIEVALFTKNEHPLYLGILPNVSGSFTVSCASRMAVGGVFFSLVRWNKPGRMLRWEVSENPIKLQSLVEGGEPVRINLETVFGFLGGLPRQFLLQCDPPGILAIAMEANTVRLTPVKRGDTLVRVKSMDTLGPEVNIVFRGMVFPEPHTVATGGFSFSEWPPNVPENTFPDHMLLLQSDTYAPELHTPLQHAYRVPQEDYAPEDTANIGFPYRNTCYSRINGLAAQGISFINAGGKNRDVGGALLALNTLAQTNVYISWRNDVIGDYDREYGMRLQYRLGIEGLFKDVLINNAPVDYAPGFDGANQPMGPFALPPELLNQPCLHLLWRYYPCSNQNGTSAQVRLDDIHVREGLKAAMDELSPVYQVVSRSCSFHVKTTGAEGPQSFQWYHGNTQKKDTLIEGATDSTLTLTNLEYAHSGWYRCQVSDDLSTASSPSVQLIVVSGLPLANGAVLCLFGLAVVVMGACIAYSFKQDSK